MWAMDNREGLQGCLQMFGKHGVYSFADLSQEQQVYESMIHIATGTKVVIEDFKPKANWIIEDNYN